MFDLTITKAQNGFILHWTEEGVLKSTVVEEHDTEDGEAAATQKLLWAVAEHFGYYGSKHDKVRTVVRLEHGSNYDCKGCDVCGD